MVHVLMMGTVEKDSERHPKDHQSHPGGGCRIANLNHMYLSGVLCDFIRFFIKDAPQAPTTFQIEDIVRELACFGTTCNIFHVKHTRHSGGFR